MKTTRKRNSISRDAVLLALALCLSVAASSFFSLTRTTEYATGEAFMISGNVTRVDGRYGARFGHLVVVETDEAMPDGTHSFISDEFADFKVLQSHEGEHVTMLFDERGFVAAAG